MGRFLGKGVKLAFVDKGKNPFPKENEIDLSEKQQVWEAKREEQVEGNKIIFSPPVRNFPGL